MTKRSGRPRVSGAVAGAPGFSFPQVRGSEPRRSDLTQVAAGARFRERPGAAALRALRDFAVTFGPDGPRISPQSTRSRPGGEGQSHGRDEGRGRIRSERSGAIRCLQATPPSAFSSAVRPGSRRERCRSEGVSDRVLRDDTCGDSGRGERARSAHSRSVTLRARQRGNLFDARTP